MKILIIRLSSFGDVLLTGFLIRNIRQSIPDSEIYFLTKKSMTPLVEYNPNLTKVFTYETEKSKRKDQISEIKKLDLDWVLDLQSNLRSIPFRSLGKNHASFRKNRLKRFGYVHFKTPFHQQPVPSRYLETAKALNISDDQKGLDCFIPVTIETRMQSMFRNWQNQSTSPVFFIAAGAKHFTKRYPAEYYVQIIQSILLDFPNAGFILLGGQDEMETSAEIKKQFSLNSRIWNASGAFSLLESCALLKQCTAGFTNDSFLMHVAAAFQKPVVSFFGSTTPQLGFAPFRSPSLVMEDKNLSCRPCTHIGRNSCPKKHFQCMMNLNPALIYPDILNFLREQKIG